MKPYPDIGAAMTLFPKLRHLALWLLLTFPALAQERGEFEFDPMARRNHVGFNTQFAFENLFRQGQQTDVQLYYRRQHKNNRALRAGLGGGYFNQVFPISAPITYSTEPGRNRSLRLSLSLGYEWQQPIGRRWWWYYGGDIGADAQWNRTIVNNNLPLNYSPSTFLYSDAGTNLYRIQAKGMLGIRFLVTKRFYLSTEIGVGAIREKIFWAQSFSASTSGDENSFQVFQTASNATGLRSTTSFNFNPSAGLSLFYLF